MKFKELMSLFRKSGEQDLDIFCYLNRLEPIKRPVKKSLLEQVYSQGIKRGINYDWSFTCQGDKVPMRSDYGTATTIVARIAEMASMVEDMEQVQITLTPIDWIAGIGFCGKSQTFGLKTSKD